MLSQVVQGASRSSKLNRVEVLQCLARAPRRSASTATPQNAPPRSRSARRLSAKPGSDLVGPPDPQSNLRPVKYGSAFESIAPAGTATSPPLPSNSPRPLSHPYSTSEFTTPSLSLSSSPSPSSPKPHSQYYHSLLQRLEVAELSHHLRRARSDRFSHNFWADNNARYNRDMAQYQQTTGGKESHLLAPFNSAWLDANSKRHRAYNHQLWAMTREDLAPAMRYSILRAWVGWVAWVEGKLGRGGVTGGV